MWDLNGMEYYWGILPPLVEAFTLWIANTSSMFPYRLLNALVGSLTIYVIYRIVLEHFKSKALAAVASAIATAWPSLLIFSTYGLTETLGIFFLLLAVFYYNKRDYVFGVLLGLASMCRIEFWFLALGLIACYLLFELSVMHLTPALAGWLTVMLPYILHIRAQTGDPFYPVYWNFFGTVLRQWEPQYALTWDTIFYRTLWLVVAGASVVIVLILMKRRPNGYIVYALFLGYLFFQGVNATLSLQGALVNVRYILDRFMMLDYLFLSILLSLLFLRMNRIKIPRLRISIQLVYGAMLVGLCVLAYASFIPYHAGQEEMKYFHEVSGWLVEHYEGGTILCNIPMLNYWLIQDGIDGRNIVGTIYISHENSATAREWLKSHDVRWFVLTKYSFDDSGGFYDFLRLSGESLPFQTEYERDMISILSVS